MSILLAIALTAAAIALGAIAFKTIDARIGAGPAAINRRLGHAPGFTARGWRRGV